MVRLSLVIAALVCLTSGCKIRDAESTALAEETTLEYGQMPGENKIAKAIAHLQKALDHLQAGSTGNAKRFVSYAKANLDTRLVAKNYKAGIRNGRLNLEVVGSSLDLTSADICFYGRYDSVVNLVNNDRYKWRRQRLHGAELDRTVPDNGAINVRLVQDGQSRGSRSIRRCNPIQQPTPIDPNQDNEDPIIVCNGSYVLEEYRFYECRLVVDDACFIGNIETMVAHIDNETFGTSEEWYENARTIDNDIIAFDFADRPNNFREEGLKLKRCKSHRPIKYTFNDAPNLAKEQLRTWLEHLGRDSSDPVTQIDENSLHVHQVNLDGENYDHVGVWIGDNVSGGVFRLGTTQLVGGNSDGDFYLGHGTERRWVSIQ